MTVVFVLCAVFSFGKWAAPACFCLCFSATRAQAQSLGMKPTGIFVTPLALTPLRLPRGWHPSISYHFWRRPIIGDFSTCRPRLLRQALRGRLYHEIHKRDRRQPGGACTGADALWNPA